MKGCVLPLSSPLPLPPLSPDPLPAWQGPVGTEFSVGWNWTKEWVWLLELGVPQGGHLGSHEICADEWAVMREWLSLGKWAVAFLG